VQRVTGAKQTIEPDAHLAQDYERLYRFYHAAEDTLRVLMQQWANR